MGQTTFELFGDYRLRMLDQETFAPLFARHRPAMFPETLDFHAWEALSEQERAARDRLRGRLGDPFRLMMGIYHRDEFVGWTQGVQKGSDEFQMVSSAVFPEHRGRGVYSAMLRRVLEILKREGFGVVTSRHHLTNNEVLVPKLKAGFVISGFEVVDVFGVLVHLSCCFNPLRRKAMEFRIGRQRPDAELGRFLNLAEHRQSDGREVD